MLRSLLLSLVLVTILPPAPASAADASATQLCVAVEGARDEVTPDELTAGIVDGSMVITAVRSCTHPPRPGQDAEDPGELEDPGPTATTKPPTKDTGQWVVNPIELDPLTDDPVTATWVYADGSRTAALIVECLSRGVTQVRIFWNLYLDLETAHITSRIGDEEPVTQGWPLDETGTSAFYPLDPLTFLASLFGKDRLVAQTRPWNRNETTLVFPIAGVEAAVSNVREACRW